MFFALGIQFLNLGLRYADSQTGTLIDIGATAAFYWLLSPFFIERWYWLTPAVLIFGAIGLFRPVLSANLSLKGVTYLGPTLTSTVSATNPLFGVAFGVLLLGETLSGPILLGTAAIMAGMVALANPRGVAAAWPLWALLFPLGAAVLRTFGHVLAKFGLEVVPNAFFAGLMAYSVSFVLALSFHLGKRERPRISWRTYGLGWFVVAGAMHGTAIFCLNSALQIGTLVTIVPVVSAYPVLTLLLSLLLFRRETITRRTLLAMALVVPGIILIALAR